MGEVCTIPYKTERGYKSGLAFAHGPFCSPPLLSRAMAWFRVSQAEPPGFTGPFCPHLSRGRCGYRHCLIHRPRCSGGDVGDELKENFDKNNRVNFQNDRSVSRGWFYNCFQQLAKCVWGHPHFLPLLQPRPPAHSLLLLPSLGAQQRVLATRTSTSSSDVVNMLDSLGRPI